MHRITFDPYKRIEITLIGVGGTGSLLLTLLLRVDVAIRQLGGAGLHIRAFDPDVVSVTNLTRQNFAPADVGRYKAITLIERCNLYAGRAWEAFPRRAEATDFSQGSHVVISCVDSGKSRREIYEALQGRSVHYWLDCGNERDTGQVVLGQLRGGPERLLHILDRDATRMQGREVNTPSCSAAEALTRQSLFINPHIALEAAELIGKLILHGETPHCAVFVNLSGTVHSVALDVPETLPSKKKKERPLLPLRKPRAPRKSRVRPAAPVGE